jgi:DNA-binding CsgD family transcriptional regulator
MAELNNQHKALGALTEKQRAVLDLVLEHKSSKEIARVLCISPYTVDQRIQAVRRKLGVSSRGEVARVYARHKAVCEETAYEFPYVDFSLQTDDSVDRDARPDPILTLSDVAVIDYPAPWQSGSFTVGGLEALDNRFGIFGRVFAVFALAGMIAMVMLVMVSIAETLTSLV